MWLPVVAGLALALIAILSVVLFVVRWAEDAFILVPAPCTRYILLPDGLEQVPLPGGGALIHYPPADCVGISDACKRWERRAVMCLHGNGGNADGMARMGRALSDRGYDVYLLENRGYGTCAREGVRATPASFRQDLVEAWAHLSPSRRSRAILLGFSMGGGSIGQFLARPEVDANDMPEQIVLLNTFADLPTVVSDLVPMIGPSVAPLLRTRWDSRPGLARYCRATSRRSHHGPGHVLLVGTADDSLIPLKHSLALLTTIPDDLTRRQFVVLPDGGHNLAIDQHASAWIPHLLAPSASHASA